MTTTDAFTDACAFVMPFGKHKGWTLARIGSNSDDLLYLDWLIGQRWIDGELKTILKTYLSHPAISRQIDALLDD